MHDDGCYLSAAVGMMAVSQQSRHNRVGYILHQRPKLGIFALRLFVLADDRTQPIVGVEIRPALFVLVRLERTTPPAPPPPAHTRGAQPARRGAGVV